MKFFVLLQVLLFLFLLSSVLEAKTPDPYKVLGVDRKANQREIQKAFHKLSLQYHPDKNKNKGAQQKFEEINNAYEILSDEEKRKNYDLYGDEKGNPGFGAGPGDNGGYTYFTQGGEGNSGFNFGSNEWQSMGGQGSSKSFSFSFGGPSGSGSSDFGLNDIFSNLFGGGARGGNQFGGFSGSARKKSETQNSPMNVRAVNSQVFVKEITDRGKSWLLLSYTPTVKGKQYYESVVADVAKSLQGAMEVGSINCETEQSFCKDRDIYPRRAPRVFVYSFNKASESGSLVEYTDDLDVKSLKTFCQEHLPRFSRRVDLGHFEISSNPPAGLPRVMLLSTKKDTPVIWRVISGLYRKRFIIYDAEVRDISDPAVRVLGVDALPAVVGWLSNGEKHVLKTGISVKDLKSAIQELSALLDGFEKKNKKAASSQAKRPQTEETSKKIPVLTAANFDSKCAEKTPVCFIGVFKSSKAREKLESILSIVSQKTLSRNRNTATASGDAISYALLDATKQSAFLNALDKSGFRSDKFLVAYKPRKEKFTAYTGEITTEEVEKFIGSVLNGDVQFKKVRQKPMVM